ncbi:MAG: hypothetical protein GEV11_29850 [Streptosporangiales bacterium]|nr:hypothetical protein [Streptosporangiales bacterium]
MTVVLSDEGRRQTLTEHQLNDLIDRIETQATREIEAMSTDRSGVSSLECLASLEGPSIAYKLTVYGRADADLNAMASTASNIFNKHWDREIDRPLPQ